MARPSKSGLEYFPLDVDFFSDEKIEAISGEFGIKGEIIALRLLCAIYRQGYFIEWTEMLRMKLLKSAPGISPELLDQIVHRLVRWGFFDKALFDSVRILTSSGIQRRYFDAVKRRKPIGELPYILVNACNNGVNAYINPVNANIYPQSKVKESKQLDDDDEIARARRQDASFFEEYFSGKTDLMPIVKQLHAENPSMLTVGDFKELAMMVLCEWAQCRQKPHDDYSDWARHLLSQARIKNRNLKPKKNNDTAFSNRQPDAEDARRRRDESYARVMQELLSGNDPRGGEMP